MVRISSSYYTMALLPKWGFGLFNPPHPDISFFCRRLSQFLHFNLFLASLSTASNHRPLGPPIGLLPPLFPYSAFFSTVSSLILIT
jgi:hypothetical protein